MSRRKSYDRADWTLSNAQLARRFGVTKQSIANARKVRGIKPLKHGGRRKGAGRKPRAPVSG